MEEQAILVDLSNQQENFLLLESQYTHLSKNLS